MLLLFAGQYGPSFYRPVFFVIIALVLFALSRSCIKLFVLFCSRFCFSCALNMFRRLAVCNVELFGLRPLLAKRAKIGPNDLRRQSRQNERSFEPSPAKPIVFV